MQAAAHGYKEVQARESFRDGNLSAERSNKASGCGRGIPQEIPDAASRSARIIVERIPAYCCIAVTAYTRCV